MPFEKIIDEIDDNNKSKKKPKYIKKCIKCNKDMIGKKKGNIITYFHKECRYGLLVVIN